MKSHEYDADRADLPDDAVAKVESERLADLDVVRDAKVWDLRRLDCACARIAQPGGARRRSGMQRSFASRDMAWPCSPRACLEELEKVGQSQPGGAHAGTWVLVAHSGCPC